MPVFFLSDSTGISAETMGNALLIQFPDLRFERRLIPFITTVEEARKVVAVLDAAMDGPVTPLAFSTTAVTEIRDELHQSRCPLIDFFDLHMTRVESILGQQGQRVAARFHGLGDVKRYNARMAAVEYAIEHDDGQSMRALDKADVILVAPSRCGKTPTTMYLALQHGIFVANYPLVEEDFDTNELPAADQSTCATAVSASPRQRLDSARYATSGEPNSRYASLEQCTYELRRAEALYRIHKIPLINSSAKSVEEMSTVILQSRHAPARRLTDTTRHPPTDRPTPPRGPPDDHRDPHQCRPRHRQRPLVLRAGPGRPGAGRRQELLARRDGGQPDLGRGEGARRLRHHRRRLPTLHLPDRVWAT